EDVPEEGVPDRARWKFEAKNGKVIQSLYSTVNIVQVPLNVFLNNHRLRLPAWGHGQVEVNGAKSSVGRDTQWFVELVSDPYDVGEVEVKGKAKGFVGKFVELQTQQLVVNNKLNDNGMASSVPIEWPFVLRGINFWSDKGNRHVHLLGNVVGWWLGI